MIRPNLDLEFILDLRLRTLSSGGRTRGLAAMSFLLVPGITLNSLFSSHSSFDLPPELLFSIAHYLPVADMVRSSEVSREFCMVMRDPFLWQSAIDKNGLKEEAENLLNSLSKDILSSLYEEDQLDWRKVYIATILKLRKRPSKFCHYAFFSLIR